MSPAKLRLAFAGTPEIAGVVLESLIHDRGQAIECVLTQPDRPAGRGRKLKQSAVKLCALQHAIPVLQPATAKELEPDSLKNCDLMLVVAYGLIIPPEILAVPKLGCINIHASLLPRWRGAAPIQRAIEYGDTKTGITFMRMNSGLDTGAILQQMSCSMQPSDTAGTLHDRLAGLAAKSVNAVLTKIINHAVVAIKQDNSKATYANKISKSEAKIDWTQPAVVLERKVRAFNPSPVAHTVINNMPIRIWEAIIKPGIHDLTVGTILHNKASLDIVTGKDILAVTKLQLPGKRMVSAKDFLNGHPELITENIIAN